jgi:hypothetical protein
MAKAGLENGKLVLKDCTEIKYEKNMKERL